MNLNAKEVSEQGIITNIGEDSIQQVGIDLQVEKIESMFGIGLIPVKGKTRLVQYKEIPLDLIITDVIDDQPVEKSGWRLTPGVYSVTFKQGCKIPKDQMLKIRQRSSMARNGSFIHSSIFDPGFETKNIGTIMIVMHPIEIEYEARIAQAYVNTYSPVENLYDGQYQKDNQRGEGK
jgi:deoxycytidine triphosphate deaminase